MASCSILIQKIKPYFAGGSNVHMYFTYVVDTDDYNTLFKMIFIYDILKQPSRMKQQQHGQKCVTDKQTSDI